METPQTITSISRAQLDDFALTGVNEVLDYVPGITVEEIETGRTYYTARGFDIVNFQEAESALLRYSIKCIGSSFRSARRA